MDCGSAFTAIVNGHSILITNRHLVDPLAFGRLASEQGKDLTGFDATRARLDRLVSVGVDSIWQPSVTLHPEPGVDLACIGYEPESSADECSIANDSLQPGSNVEMLGYSGSNFMNFIPHSFDAAEAHLLQLPVTSPASSCGEVVAQTTTKDGTVPRPPSQHRWCIKVGPAAR